MNVTASFEVTWEVLATATYCKRFTLDELLADVKVDTAARVRAGLAAGTPFHEVLPEHSMVLPDNESDSSEIDYVVHERDVTEAKPVVVLKKEP